MTGMHLRLLAAVGAVLAAAAAWVLVILLLTGSI